MKQFNQYLAEKKLQAIEEAKPQDLKDIEAKILEAKEANNLDLLETLIAEKLVIEEKYKKEEEKEEDEKKDSAKDKMKKKMDEAAAGDTSGQQAKESGDKEPVKGKKGKGGKAGFDGNQDKKDASEKDPHPSSKKGSGGKAEFKGNQEKKDSTGYPKTAMESYDEFTVALKEGIEDGSWDSESIDILENVLINEDSQTSWQIDDLMSCIMQIKKMAMPHSRFYASMDKYVGDEGTDKLDKMFDMSKEMMDMVDALAIEYGDEYMDQKEEM